MGYKSLSKSQGSYSFGYKASALGTGCFAMGSVGVDTLGNFTNELTVADGIHSFAIGQGATTISGIGNMAIGPNTTAQGSLRSLAIGYRSLAMDKYSISIGTEGMYTSDMYPTPAIAQNVAEGSSSMALGFGNRTFSNYSLSFGIANKSYGYRSISMGYRTIAEGDYSITLGDKITAKAYGSFVIGRYNIIEGDSLNWVNTDPLFVIGNGSKVLMSVVRSNALTVLKNGYTGINTNQPVQMLDVNGNGIIRGTIQTGGESIELNTISTGNRYAYIDFHGDDTYTDYSLRIMRYNSGINAASRFHHRGTGSFQFYNQEAAPFRFYSNSSEVFTISSNGYIGIGDITPNYKLDIYDNSTELYAARIFKDYNSSSYGGLMIQAGADDGSGTNIMVGCYDGNGTYAGSLAIDGTILKLVTPSDKNLKSNIENTQLKGLEIINKLRIVDFEYKKSPGIKHTGYIAQEVNEVFPEMVTFNEQEGIFQISQMQLIPILNKAIQEQQMQIDDLNHENINLKSKLDEINTLYQDVIKRLMDIENKEKNK